MTAPNPPADLDEIGVIIVDHGSRRDDSNRMLLDVVRLFERSTPYRIVEPAHMDLAQPTIHEAFQRCVQRGAKLVIVHPYFLLPGRHWEEDIPKLAGDAASPHPGVRYLVTSPLGLHPLMVDVINDRIDQCLGHARGATHACEICEGTDRCQLR